MRVLVELQVLLFTVGFAGKWAQLREQSGYFGSSDENTYASRASSLGNQWTCSDSMQPFLGP